MTADRENRLYDDLKKLRLQLSRNYNMPVWKVFNDKQLELIIETLPTDINSLKNLNILSPQNLKLLGKNIIKIIHYYSNDFENDEDFTYKVKKLFQKAHNPSKFEYFNENKFNPKYISVARKTNKNNEFSRTGFFNSSKMKRNIHFESELERQFYLRLEKLENIKYYFPQPFKIKYQIEYVINNFKYSKEKIYFPDILVVFSDNSQCLVEIKNYYHLINLNSKLKLFLCNELKEKRGIGYLFSTNYQHSLDEAINYPYNVEFFNNQLKEIDKNGSISEVSLNRKRVSYNIKKQELLPFCYKNNLCLENGVITKLDIKRVTIKDISMNLQV